MATGEMETAAREAVTNLQPFLQHLGEMEKDCHAAAEQVEALRRLLDEDEKALEEAVTALAHEADQMEQELTTDAHTAIGSVSRLVLAFQQAHTEAPGDVDAETAMLANAAALLNGLAERVQEVAGAVESGSQAALDEAAAVVQALEQAVDQVEQLVSVAFVSLVADLERGLETFTSQLVKFLTEDCEHYLDEHTSELTQKVEAAHGYVEMGLALVEKHAGDVMEYAEGEWTRRVDDALATSEADVVSLVNELSDLTQAAAEEDRQVKAAAEHLEERLHQAAQEAGTVEQELNETRGRWATFGVTC
jgi:uncharacterized phage infection (PIP) family protein YhgE